RRSGSCRGGARGDPGNGSGIFPRWAPMIPVSSRTRAGIDTLKGEIRMLALACPERPTDHPLRLPIDRAFTIRGFGTVVTGTLMPGEIEKDQEVELIPGSLVTKVRGIQLHGTLHDRRCHPAVASGVARVVDTLDGKHNLASRAAVSALRILQAHVLGHKITVGVAGHEVNARDWRVCDVVLGLSENVLSQACVASA